MIMTSSHRHFGHTTLNKKLIAGQKNILIVGALSCDGKSEHAMEKHMFYTSDHWDYNHLIVLLQGSYSVIL